MSKINENISEFMTLTTKNKALIIFEMVDELAKETELPLTVVCKMVADYKGWSTNRVKKYLNMYDERYLNTIAMFQDNKAILKSKMNEACYTVLKDKLTSIVTASPFMVPASFLKRVLNDYATEVKW